ncbi:hypothetical protein MKW92_005775 [Papaver armeniacum]|nr:hypothetical protein MKW92_005775 [Papaver armeniacum]
MKMKNNRHGLMVEDMKMMKEDWTFVLFYPSSFAAHRDIGKMLTACEKIGLNIIENFVPHILAGMVETLVGESLPLHLTPHPFIAMVLQGDDAIYKALQLTSATFKLQAYSSCSCISALEDYELWFELKASKFLACAFPDDTISGPTKVGFSWFLSLLLCFLISVYYFRNFVDNFYEEDLTFVLIRPLAFQKRCVGELVSIIERNSSYSKHGLLIVVPQVKSMKIIAMLVRYITPERIQIVNNGDGRICTDNDAAKIEICSNLIYLGKPGDKGIIGDFFKFGAVSWVDLTSGSNCGGYFAATLSSLQF